MKLKSMIYSLASLIAKLILNLLYLLELFLFLRLILKFFGASKNALVVRQIYEWSNFFVSPFDSIFPNFWQRGYFIETSVLAAMAGYAILVYAFFKILRLD